MAATVFARQRVSGVDRCAYSGGPAPEVRDRLFVPLAGLRWLEGEACPSPEVRRRGGLCECPTHGRGLRHGQAHSERSVTCCRGRGRSTPSGTGILSPYAWAVPGRSGSHPAARNVRACGGGTVASGCSGGVRYAPVQPAPSVELPAVRLDDMGRERSPSA